MYIRLGGPTKNNVQSIWAALRIRNLSVRLRYNRKTLPSGRYLLRIDMVQQGVQWFCQHHPHAGLSLFLKIGEHDTEVNQQYKNS